MTTSHGDFALHYKLLNKQQKQAVDHSDGPMIVLAGAGTGKTQIIALRIAKLLQTTDLEPRNILCLTFTETGVANMRQRLLDIVGPAAYQVKLHTFHSFCNEVILDHPELFLFAYDLAPLSDIERIEVFQEVLDQLPPESNLKPFAAPYFYVSDLARVIQTLKRENYTPERYQLLVDNQAEYLEKYGALFDDVITQSARAVTYQQCADVIEQLQANSSDNPITKDIVSLYTAFPPTAKSVTPFHRALKQYITNLRNQLPKQQDVTTVYQLYQTALQQRGRYDYEDMLLFVVSAFTKQPELLSDYQEQYQYILVDEYQDTNGAQNELVRLLGSYFESPNIFVVGDDRQSIFRFQGAALENILYFYDLYKTDVKLISLQDNYRSQQTILDAADACISHSTYSLQAVLPNIPQQLQAARQLETQPVGIAEFASAEEEYFWLSTTIQQLIAQGVAPSEIAVLYRNNADIDPVLELFTKQAIPFTVVAGHNILDDRDVQQIITLLRWFGRPDHDDDLWRMLFYPFWKLDALDCTKITHYATRQRLPLLSVLTSPEQLQAAGVTHIEAFINWVKQLSTWQQRSHQITLVESVDELLFQSGYMTWLTQQPDSLERLNRIQSLLRELRALNYSQPNLTPRDFVEHIDVLRQHAVVLPEQPLQTQRAAVQCMTAHRAKGLEFEYVFMMKCVDRHWGNVPDRSKLKLPVGLLQHDIGTDVVKRNEDERRLFYVAMTRAKLSLTLTHATRYTSQRTSLPSAFIQDIPETFRQTIDTTAVTGQLADRLHLSVSPTPINHDALLIEHSYVQELVKQFRFSATALNSYLECPRQFYFEHIVGVPRLNTRAFAFGTAIHETLRDVVVNHLDKKSWPKPTWIKQQYEQHLKKQLLSTKQYQETLAFGQGIIAAYVHNHKKALQQAFLAEKNFSGFNVMIDDIPIVGSIDRLDVIDQTAKTVQVVDYKTGNPDNKKSQLGPNGAYHRQLVFYKLLCDGAKPFGYKAVSGEIQFVQPSKKTGEFMQHTIEFTDDHTNIVKEQLQQAWQEMTSLEFLQLPEERYCGDCDYCTLVKSA